MDLERLICLARVFAIPMDLTIESDDFFSIMCLI